MIVVAKFSTLFSSKIHMILNWDDFVIFVRKSIK